MNTPFVWTAELLRYRVSSSPCWILLMVSLFPSSIVFFFRLTTCVNFNSQWQNIWMVWFLFRVHSCESHLHPWWDIHVASTRDKLPGWSPFNKWNRQPICSFGMFIAVLSSFVLNEESICWWLSIYIVVIVCCFCWLS